MMFATVLAEIQVEVFVNFAYLIAASLFIFGLKMLSNMKTARAGNMVSSVGMLLATVATFFLVSKNQHGADGSYMISFVWVAIALLLGSAVGLVLALRTPMTGMPQMVALLNGFGGIASLLVAVADYARLFLRNELTDQTAHALIAVGMATLVGGITFTGSLVAFGKLQGLKITPTKPIQFAGQKTLIGTMTVGAVLLSVFMAYAPTQGFVVPVIALIALILGILLVIGIGGADMPVVVSLLNSYSGIAAAMAGFVLGNVALIITGSLVGASGIILTSIMCKAMNRSLANVLFGGVGGDKAAGSAEAGSKPQGNATEYLVEDAVIAFESAQLVIIVPGYGMAVAQAQHAVKDLGDQLEARGITVKYAIHPVAGRMPGHMNVLLAEAQVSYEALCDLETINPEFEQADVALVIGANDVTNPAARHAKDSPIYGMPILNVDQARQVFVIKRSLNPGFAGIENELYFKKNCGMLFGDAKKVVTELVSAMKANA